LVLGKDDRVGSISIRGRGKRDRALLKAVVAGIWDVSVVEW